MTDAAPVPAPASGFHLRRVRPAHNEWRFYRAELWPDLFGGVALVRVWGRIGTAGRLRADPYPDDAAAAEALARLEAVRRKRGYRNEA